MGLNNVRSRNLLNAVTSTNSAPTVVTDGVHVPQGVDRADMILKSTAGSGTLTVTIRLWGWSPVSSVWVPLSIGADSAAGDTSNTAGWMNGGNAIVEVGTNILRHYEEVMNLSLFSRIYAQVVAIGGTSTAVTLDAVFHRAERR